MLHGLRRQPHRHRGDVFGRQASRDLAHAVRLDCMAVPAADASVVCGGGYGRSSAAKYPAISRRYASDMWSTRYAIVAFCRLPSRKFTSWLYR